MRRFFTVMLAAAALASCTKNPSGQTDGAGTLRIEGENEPFVSALTRADGRVELSELGQTAPDPMGLRTLISCMDTRIDLGGGQPWKEYDSADDANAEQALYLPAGYVVTLAMPTEDGVLPSYAVLSSGETVSGFDRPYYAGGGTLIPVVAEGRNLPYFEGRAEVTVRKQETATARVTLKVANAAVRIRFSEAFRNYFENGAEILLKTRAAGSAEGNTFTVSYGQDEDTVFWIRPQGFTLSGSAVRQDPSPGIIEARPVRFEDYVVKDADVRPQTLYTYVFDMEEAGNVAEKGIRITVNSEPVGIIDDEIELNPDAPIK